MLQCLQFHPKAINFKLHWTSPQSIFNRFTTALFSDDKLLDYFHGFLFYVFNHHLFILWKKKGLHFSQREKSQLSCALERDNTVKTSSAHGHNTTFVWKAPASHSPLNSVYLLKSRENHPPDFLSSFTGFKTLIFIRISTIWAFKSPQVSDKQLAYFRVNHIK
jgi:hypothetical protein